MQKAIRPCGGVSDNIIIAAILSIVVVYAGGIISLFLFGFLDIEEKLIAWTGSDNLGTFLSDYLFTIGAILSVCCWVSERTGSAYSCLCSPETSSSRITELIR